MKVDYIIVGLGIGGIALCETLRKRNKSFVVFDSGIHCATAASGGVVNPTILKRFNTPWNTEIFYPPAVSFYEELSHFLAIPCCRFVPIDRIFSSVEEQNNWFVASDKKRMRPYLKAHVVPNFNDCLIAPLGFGEVNGSMQLSIADILLTYRSKLRDAFILREESVDYNNIRYFDGEIIYKTFAAGAILFAEGPQVVMNPFFPKGAIIPNKGEYLIIHAPDLKLKRLIKGNHYIIPIGDDRYKVGATFEGVRSDWDPSPGIKEFLESELRRMISCPFVVESELVGIRATTDDHKPLIGRAANYENMAFLNGLGTRGLMMAPHLADLLISHFEEGHTIPYEMDISRLY